MSEVPYNHFHPVRNGRICCPKYFDTFILCIINLKTTWTLFSPSDSNALYRVQYFAKTSGNLMKRTTIDLFHIRLLFLQLSAHFGNCLWTFCARPTHYVSLSIEHLVSVANKRKLENLVEFYGCILVSIAIVADRCVLHNGGRIYVVFLHHTNANAFRLFAKCPDEFECRICQGKWGAKDFNNLSYKTVEVSK